MTFSFGSSTDLAEQVADGAPGDVLATADETSMGLAEDAGVTGEVETFATNVLTIVVPAGNPAGITSLDDLDGDDVGALRRRGPVRQGRRWRSWTTPASPPSRPASRRTYAPRSTRSSRARPTPAWSTRPTPWPRATTSRPSTIPDAEANLTSYYATTLEQSEDADLAADWVAWVTSDEGQAILGDAGFGSP